jgi:hypothetical protein
MLPPHPTKNTRVALPRTAINFIASVLLLISSSSQHAFADRACPSADIGAKRLTAQWRGYGLWVFCSDRPAL